MPNYRWRDWYPGSEWQHDTAADANTIKARIPAGGILEVQASNERWVPVAKLPELVVGSGNSIAVRGPDGATYSSILAATKALGMKYSTIRGLVNGRHGGWRRA